MVHSKIVHKADYDEEEYRLIGEELKEGFRYHRKPWEFIMATRVLKERGYLQPGNLGIGFGVGSEPLSAYFAKQGCKIIATDQPMANANVKNWTGSDQYCEDKANLNKRGICPSEIFEANVEFRPVDMNYIPVGLPKADFIWSMCALEHLGTLQNGLWFVVRSMSLLKPGGIAVHSTEYNLSSNTDTNFQHANCIYRQKDLKILEETINSLGYYMEPVNVERGIHEYDLYVDLGGWSPVPKEPHLNLKIDGFDATSALLIIENIKPE